MRFYALVILSLFLGAITHARAQNVERPFVHVVREGETLASIAERYYGDVRRESVLVTENGLNSQGGAAIVVGLRLHIPTVTYHRVVQGETWNVIAERYLGEARRAATLIEINGGSAATPDPGAVILVPYPLRHVASQHEDLVDIAKLYYGHAESITVLRRYNAIRGTRLERGQIVLVPLSDLTLSEEGKHLVEANVGTGSAGGRLRELQARVEHDIPLLDAHVRLGHYVEAVALGHELIGTAELTTRQRIAIQSALAIAYEAFDRRDLAVRCYREVLELDPEYALDVRRTSPRILEALRLAHEPEEVAPSTDAGLTVDASHAH